MIRSRIREIRKERGLTLQQVAESAKTTAQTIGRLETGMRTLSIDWVERIAEALDADPSELLSLPQEGDLEITGRITVDGSVARESGGTVSPRLIAGEPIVLRVERNMGAYRAGDVVVCDATKDGYPASGSLDHDCLVSLEGGQQMFARVISAPNAHERNCADLVPIEQGGAVKRNVLISSIAPAVLLLRQL